MSKPILKVTVNHQQYRAPVWELDNLKWQDTRLGCPYCGIFSPINPLIDVIQFGLENNDSVHTVIRCEYCAQVYALHYINTQEVEE